MKNETRFDPVDPIRWEGHYERISGRRTSYHAKSDGGLEVRWQDPDDADVDITSPIRMTDAARKLAEAVNRTKQRQTGSNGGAFLLNEHGQVLVPTGGSYQRWLVGEVTGALELRDPDDSSRWISTDPGDEYRTGDLWRRPYVGSCHHLAVGGHIYREIHQDDEVWRHKPPHPNRELVEKLRKIRGNSGCRFIVTEHGHVVTKREDRAGIWQPVYVGRIDYQSWYPKESPSYSRT